MEFFSSLETILSISNPFEKIDTFYEFYRNFEKFYFEHKQKSKIFYKPSFEGYCKVVDPKEVPKRGRLNSKEGRAILLHAIAHIEYSAIDLAIDAAYRFKNMPKKFYIDWLEVADDECRHFLEIESLLRELGYAYGDFAVHKGLFEAGLKTQDLISRMAVVPRYLEANGLDANPKIIKRLENFEDEFAKRMRKTLNKILSEEVEHVKKGDFWFKYACKKEGIKDYKSHYFKIVDLIYPGAIHSKDVNIEDRKRAGFSCEEIKLLSKRDIECL
jgi:uncharacterized ferritin-like protein (DUF455 family)